MKSDPAGSYSAHATFPLSSSVLSRCSLTPEFSYVDSDNARKLQAFLGSSSHAFSAGELSAAGILGRIYLHLLKVYLRSNPAFYNELDKQLRADPGLAITNKVFLSSLKRFPTTPVYYNPSRISEYLLDYTGDPHLRHAFYNTLILLIAAEENPSLRVPDGVFTDPVLRNSAEFLSLKRVLISFINSQAPVRDTGKSLFVFLLDPVHAHPDSLFGQLNYIHQHWSTFVGNHLLLDLLSGLDKLKEEFNSPVLTPSPPSDPLGFARASYSSNGDQVRFSADRDWMPRVVLLAKNVYVWLDQLSRLYQRSIYRLEHIPEEEFSKLASWGITGLWLIGIWERSPASQQIKQICGNPDAVPSAYSLYDYTIAEALGGDAGYLAVRELASKYGIRLAADMVPNHMGIYSKWIVEHPDWFLSLDRSPFQAYSFNGPDLSEDPSIGIFLEDHYYSKTDAAVVFKRIDRKTNAVRYIYHGNDGTSMPWNDTAQLDFLNPAVREAVFQAILDVAKKFPIIRFDAAMTLTKKHYQRLWFPEPGTGGAIPTRSDFGLSRADFDKLMPEEFWREVIDRLASESPDTLLLAEAFWMMEGYFVRSLGMHRVYNSAFMHMLRDEDNSKFRDLIIKTLEFDPQILKRYVNFLNNPDEDTAVSQFGSDGKYFGACVLMSTMPGLPMFGHGQIEGYTEKYGMEYRRAYYDEVPDQSLIERHQREIFPLLHQRYRFAEVDNFVIYDFLLPDRHVNHDVFVYSNRVGADSCLVVFHNKWGDTRGRIHSSPSIKGLRTTLLNGLGVSPDEGDYLLFRDHISGLEYIRDLSTLASQGLELYLGAYHYKVFLDFKIVSDSDGSYRTLANQLDGRGVHSLEFERQALILEPLRKSLLSLFELINCFQKKPPTLGDLSQAESAVEEFLNSVDSYNNSDLSWDRENVRKNILGFIKLLQGLVPEIPDIFPMFLPCIALLTSFQIGLKGLITEPQLSYIYRSLLRIPQFDPNSQKDRFFPQPAEFELAFALLPALDSIPLELPGLVDFWFKLPAVRDFLKVHEYDGLEWFHKESFETLLSVTLSLLFARELSFAPASIETSHKIIDNLELLSREALLIMHQSNYQVESLRKLVSNTAAL